MFNYTSEKTPLTLSALKNPQKNKEAKIDCGVSGMGDESRFQNEIKWFFKAEIKSFSKCPHKRAKAGGPGRTRTCNQTVMSGRL